MAKLIGAFLQLLAKPVIALILSYVVNSEFQTEFMRTLTLKDVLNSIGLAWRKVSPVAIENGWKKMW
jgi:hypothetical protein